MLNFQSIGMRPPDGQSLQSSSSTGVRLLAGQLPDVQLGVEIPARIIEMVHGKALLQLAESTIQIEQPPGAQEGAQVIIRLLQDSPQPLLDVRVVGNAGPASASSWQVGQELVASVIGQSGEHQLLLETQGTQLDAVSPHDFPVGSALKLQVDQVEPQIVLLVIDHFPNVQLSALQVLRTHLQAQVPMGESIAAIEQAIEQLHQDSSSAGKAESDQLQTLLKSILPHAEEPESDRIAEYVRNGGLNYEAKLAGAASAGLHGLAKVAAEDFKGAALKLLQALEQEGNTDAAKTPSSMSCITRNTRSASSGASCE